MFKEPHQAHALNDMVQQQLREVPAIHAALADDPSFLVLIGEVRPHERDARGRNWDIDAFRTGFGHWPQCHAEFRAIVDRLRLRYDLG
jgi:hypothetical protein